MAYKTDPANVINPAACSWCVCMSVPQQEELRQRLEEEANEWPLWSDQRKDETGLLSSSSQQTQQTVKQTLSLDACF